MITCGCIYYLMTKSLSTFAAKRDCSRINRYKRDYIRNLKAQLIAVYFNRYRGRKYSSLFKMSMGHYNIVYEGRRNFLYKNGLYKMFVMSLDFAEIKNIENMSMRMTYRTH